MLDDTNSKHMVRFAGRVGLSIPEAFSGSKAEAACDGDARYMQRDKSLDDANSTRLIRR